MIFITWAKVQKSDNSFGSLKTLSNNKNLKKKIKNFIIQVSIKSKNEFVFTTKEFLSLLENARILKYELFVQHPRANPMAKPRILLEK